MSARLIRWSASNLMLILIAIVLTTGAGLYAVSKVPLDAIGIHSSAEPDPVMMASTFRLRCRQGRGDHTAADAEARLPP